MLEDDQVDAQDPAADDAERARQDADAEHERQLAEAELIKQEAEAAASDPAAQTEWIRQSNLIYGSLAGAGLVLVQPFLTVATLDVSAMICVIAFAVAIPLLAALILVNRQEEFRRTQSPSRLVRFARMVGQGSAFVGLVAAFWHMSWIAGVVVFVVSCVGVSVHSTGYVRLEFDSRFRRRKHPAPPQP